MDKQTAVFLLDEYFQRDDALDLNEKQEQVIIRQLMWLTYQPTPEDVAKIVEENPMFRTVSPNRYTPEASEKQRRSQQTQQSAQEQKQILAQFLTEDYAARVAPNMVRLVDQNGKIVSKINFNAFAAAVKSETTYGTGKHPVRHDILSEIVLRLDQAGLLEHVPQVVERVVEKLVPTPLTRREEAKQNFKLEKQMNRAESPIKGINEEVAKKPVVSETELARVAAHDLEQNSIMGEINTKIAIHAHHGRSHSATSFEKKILENIRDAGIRAGLPNEKIDQQIDAKRSEMTKWSPQQALKELRPELFTSQPKAGY